MTDTPELTEEEHNARAMLMGMVYHHGNGFPMYFETEDGMPIVSTMLDARTLEPLFNNEPELEKHAQYLIKRSKDHWK